MNLRKINFFRLSLKDKMLFARHMEMMTRSGMQILQSLEVLKRQATSRAFIQLLDDLIADIKNGHFLAAAMERHREVFGDFMINLVRVGESSGTLSENFKYLSTELAKKGELNRKIRGAMAYPVIILFATFGIVGILAFFIFPRILPVLKSLGVQLPLATRIFIAVSETLVTYGLWIFLGLFALAIGFWLILRIRSVRLTWHRILLRIPLVGRLVQQVNLINIARTLSLLLKGGVLIVPALEITKKTLGNLVYSDSMEQIQGSVQGGDPISKLMIATGKLFPPTFAQMVAVGENTGKLDETLIFLADFYESELDGTTKALSNVLEPLLLLVMGGVVSFVALAIITPIYKISQTLGR